MSAIKDGFLYDPVAKKLRKATDEEYVRQEMLLGLQSEYHYSFEDMETEFPIHVGRSRKRIDIAIFPEGVEHLQENVYLIVECKAAKIGENDKKDGIDQLISYMSSCPISTYGLWTNGPGGLRQVIHRETSTGVIEKIDIDIPKFGEDISGDKGPKIEDLVPATSESLKWRFKKCHDIISTSGDDKMTAFWEFLKVIETKIADEREDKEYSDFYVLYSETRTMDGINKIYNRINSLYRRLIVSKYDNSLGFLGDTINIKPASLARIVGELENYSLLDTSSQVKGAAYEEIVGANLRGDKGEFFTPRGVIEAAVELLDIRSTDICTDLACGSGGFVISMLEAGRRAIEAKYAKRKGSHEDSIAQEKSSFASNNIIANDINRNLANACSMNMLMNGVQNAHVYDQDILEPPQNWVCKDAEKLRASYGLKKKTVGGHIFYVGNITKIGANPPFGNNIVRTEKDVLDQFELAEGRTSQIVEILFLERIIHLLVPGKGRAAIIVPQSILNNPGLEYVRKWIMAHTRVRAVIELPVETFLISGREGTGTLTAILVLDRRPLEETVKILDGVMQPENYPIYMSDVKKVGYDRRGNSIYKKDDEGRDITEEVNVNNQRIRKKVLDNDLPDAARMGLDFIHNVENGKVYYDTEEEVYRVLQ